MLVYGTSSGLNNFYALLTNTLYKVYIIWILQENKKKIQLNSIELCLKVKTNIYRRNNNKPQDRKLFLEYKYFPECEIVLCLETASMT